MAHPAEISKKPNREENFSLCILPVPPAFTICSYILSILWSKVNQLFIFIFLSLSRRMLEVIPAFDGRPQAVPLTLGASNHSCSTNGLSPLKLKPSLKVGFIGQVRLRIRLALSRFLVIHARRYIVSHTVIADAQL